MRLERRRGDRLARGLRARFARHEALVHAPEMSLVARAVPVTLLSVQRHGHSLQWAPRLQFLLERGAARGPEAGRAAATLSGRRRQRLEAVVQRILLQSSRRDGAAAGAVRAAPAPPAPFVALPAGAARAPDVPARVLQHPAPAAAAAAAAKQAVATAERAAPAADARWPGWPPPRATAAAVPDVERLTDQVMQAIGRRMAAHRERRGR